MVNTDTGEQTANSTGSIVLGRPELNFARFLLSLVAGNIVFSSGFLSNRVGSLLHFIDGAPSGKGLASLRDRLEGFIRKG
jgi:hypothetical protein